MDNDRYYQLGSYDKLFNEIDELTDALSSRDAEVAELRRQVTLLRYALRNLWNERTPDSYDEAGEALAATKRYDRS